MSHFLFLGGVRVGVQRATCSRPPKTAVFFRRRAPAGGSWGRGEAVAVAEEHFLSTTTLFPSVRSFAAPAAVAVGSGGTATAPVAGSQQLGIRDPIPCRGPEIASISASTTCTNTAGRAVAAADGILHFGTTTVDDVELLQGKVKRKNELPLDIRPSAAAGGGSVGMTLPLHDAGEKKKEKYGNILWELAKGKLTVWVCLSALPGYFIAAGPGALTAANVLGLFVGTGLCSTASQIANQILEVDLDRQMKRTQNRPLVRNALSIPEAKLLATTTLATGAGLLALQHSALASFVAVGTFATYAFLYTPMKQVSPYNTHLGAVAGALPTCIGFAAAHTAAVANLSFDLLLSDPWLPHCAYFFGFQALWQMPHFYSLAWLYREDYKSANFRMFCTDDDVGAKTASVIEPWMYAILCYPFLGYWSGVTHSYMFVLSTTATTLFWLRSFHRFKAKPSKKTCRTFFKVSLLHLLTVIAFFQMFSSIPKCFAEGSGREEELNGFHAFRLYVRQEWCLHQLLHSMGDFCPVK